MSSYFLWHFFVALGETLNRKHLSWGRLATEKTHVVFSWSELRSVLRSVGLVSVAVWLGAITTQLDRSILSQMVSIEDFGLYSLASSIALGLLQLIYPVIQAYTPLLIKAKQDPTRFRQTNLHLFCSTFGLMLLIFVSFLFFGRSALAIWLQNAGASASVYQVLVILILGTLLNSLYNVGYLNWLIFDRVKTMVLTNVLSVCFCIFATPLLIKEHGITGAAYGWLFTNVLGFVLSTGWIFELKKQRSQCSRKE